MRTSSTTLPNPATFVVQTIVCDQPDDVAEVHAESEFRLFVRFHDNTAGTVEIKALINSPQAGVFARLADPTLFSEARVELGAVTWPNGVDLAPDAMYLALKESGVWTLR